MLAEPSKSTLNAVTDSESQADDAEGGHRAHPGWANADELRRDIELLQLQLEQAQEELDAAYQRLADGASRQSRDATEARLETLRVLDVVESPPHRHLHVELRDARVYDRQWDALEVRLLEHHGRPGLAFFASGGTGDAVSAWRASGNENGREFMLIVPSDDAGRSVLTSLGSSDWRAVRGTVELLIQQLRKAKDGRAARWLLVALRLQCQMDAMPPRLRYDTAGIELDPVDEGWLRPSFGNVDFGGRALGDVMLRWHPEHHRLQWLAPSSDAAIPLASWPLDSEGALRAELMLPLGRQASASEQRGWWARLPASERMLILGLLDALPGALRNLPVGMSEAATLRAAKALHRDARRNWLRCRLRMAAWRVLRRSAAPAA
jgi:hypothetical protein